LLLASCDQPGKSSTAEPSPEAAPEFKPPAQVEAPTLRFELTVTLNDPADLRVKEGDRGSIIPALADLPSSKAGL